MARGTSRPAPKKDRTQVAITARGLIAETFPLAACTSGGGPNSGDCRGALVGLRAGDVVANITIALTATTAGVGTSKASLALYSKAGVLLASSADSPSSFNTSSVFVTLAMSTPYTVPIDDGYYAAFFITTATTIPSILKLGNVVPQQLAFGSGAAPTVVQAGQVSLPSPATFTASPFGIWFGIS